MSLLHLSSNSQTYTSSTTDVANLTNVAGSDSILTLDLTIYTGYSNTETITECDSYTWAVNGFTYTTSGTYVETFTVPNGCDSTLTLDLTINTVDVSVTKSGENLTVGQTGALYELAECPAMSLVVGSNQTYNRTYNVDFSVIVDLNGCIDTSACYTIDSRNITIRNRITEVCYSVQTTVDAIHNIPIDYLTSNKNDAKAMGPMLKRAVEIIGHNKFTALYDKGYHTGSELKMATEIGVNTIVSAPDLGSASRAPNPAYNVQHFKYDQENDQYICPQNQALKSNQNWYTNSNTRTRFKQYKTKACLSCKVKKQCTSAKNGKLISRSEYQYYYEQNKISLEENMPLYRRRQAIV
ncbi:MAG: transposase, partial [Crocinitomicaceae bacterium]|nr:transposase [Crocinitomicaceae bacterium]